MNLKPRTLLSVNINKIALLRNSRGANFPDLQEFARDFERFGAQGITVHPRPDERHVRLADLAPLKAVVTTELNVEGFPSAGFINHLLGLKPKQVTLVPDGEAQLTSDHGWKINEHRALLTEVIKALHAAGIRISLFLDPDIEQVNAAAELGIDRIELYTGPYAEQYHQSREEAIAPYVDAAEAATALGLGVNAGHDLNLDNLHYLKTCIPQLAEVSIGHALIVDCLRYGMLNTIQLYLRCLEN